MTTTTISTAFNHGIILGEGNFGDTLTITPTGILNSASYAIYGIAGTITNEGKIDTGDFGIYLASGGELLNTGSIYGKTLGGGGVGLTVTNAGTIGGGREGALLGAFSTLHNSGLITSKDIALAVIGAMVDNTGTVNGGVAGIYMESGSLVNAGTIFGATLGIDGVSGSIATPYDSYPIAITNTAEGRISSTEVGVALRSAGSPVALTNDGSVSGSITGVYLENSGLNNAGGIHGGTVGVALYSGSVINTGSITGSLAGIYAYGGSIIDSGLISGHTYAVEALHSIALTLQTGGSLAGTVLDKSGDGLLDLAAAGGTVSGFGSSIAGFSTIDLTAGAAWTLAGNAAGLASGGTINGLAAGDAIELTGFAASSETLIAGGLILGNGSTSETVGLSGNFLPQLFSLSTSNGNTLIEMQTPASAISVISITLPDSLMVRYGYVAQTVTITNSGTVEGTTGVQLGGTLLNAGLLAQDVVLDGYASLENSGTLDGAIGVEGAFVANTVDNSGLIDSAFYAVDRVAFLINTGTIIGPDGAFYGEGGVTNSGRMSGEIVFSDGTLTNSGSISAAGLAVHAGFYGSIENSGEITGQATGVYLGNFGAGGLYNTGTISGGTIGVVAYEARAPIVNSGLIAGGSFALENLNAPFDGALNLTVTAGGRFEGAVVDEAGGGQLVLAGSQAGSLDIGTSFSGFSAFSFAAGSSWTLQGSLAGSETIAGFDSSDTLLVDAFLASSASFVAGVGLILANATQTETLGITGGFSTADFTINTLDGGTEITVDQRNTLPISLISSLFTHNITPGSGVYASNLTIARSGAVITSDGSAAVYGGVSIFNYGVVSGIQANYVLNAGTIAGGFGVEGGETGDTNNRGLIDITASSYSGGVGIGAAFGHVTNSGTIIGAGVGVFAGSLANQGYIFGDHAVDATQSVGNSGTIIGSELGVDGTRITLDNSGDISSGGVGVYLDFFSTLINSGTISGGIYAVSLSGSNVITADPGARFNGAVTDSGGDGMFALAGSTPAELDMGNSFSGFGQIMFDSGAAWTLEGSAGDLASGQTISGFLAGDSLILDSFAAANETFIAGVGLILGNGTLSETLGITGSFPAADFSITALNGDTTITALASVTGLVSTISTYLAAEVTPGAGVFGPYVTITDTGTIAPASGLAIYTAYSAGAVTINNAGTINGKVVLRGSAATLENTGVIVPSYFVAGKVLLINTGVIGYGGQGSGLGLRCIGGTLVNSGTISGERAIGWYGTTLLNSGTIEGVTGISAAAGSIVNNGLIAGTSDAVYFLGAGNLTNAGTIDGTIDIASNDVGITVAQGAVFSGPVIDRDGDGMLELAAGPAAALDMGGSFSGFDQISFASGATWTLAGSAAELASGQTISGFAVGDTIVLENLAVTAGSFVAGEGFVITGSGFAETLELTGVVSSDTLSVAAVGANAVITEAVACFAKGTRIATARGSQAVETLQAGDLVKTAAHGYRPVRWIGMRSYDGRLIAGNTQALPIRIRRHALAFNVPARDLYVSPDHAIYEGGVLVYAWRLVNGVSITQAEQVERVDYFHVELDSHDIIFAENTPAESYLDTGCRERFQNAASAPPAQAGEICARRIVDGYYLARLQARINARAGLTPAKAVNGALRGNIDGMAPVLYGWAQDMSAPEMPVELEILCNGVEVQKILANRFREDLRAAGLGSGCHAFEWMVPKAWRGQVTLRRASDGTPLRQPQAEAFGQSRAG